MTDWILYKDAHPELFDIDRALIALVNSLPDLKDRWDKYIHEEYKNYSTERLDYIDIGEIAHFILDKFKAGQTMILINSF